MPPTRLWPAIDVQPVAAHRREDLQDAVLAELDDASVTAVQELPAAWRFFFTTGEARDRALALLRNRWAADLTLTIVDVADDDWARRSQETLGPVRVGQVLISPPWATLPSDPPPFVKIVIQPSMGFGTGHHASTRLCTALLQQIDLAGRRVLDVGTGSGVLALVALRLGAASVLGIDDDPDALESARENLQLNNVTSGIEFRQADFRTLDGLQFDVVLANLTGGLLIRGAANLLPTVAPGGSLILSGITAEEEASVTPSFDPHLDPRARLEEEGWIGLRYANERRKL